MTNSTIGIDDSSTTSEQSADRSDIFFQMDERKNEFLATLAHELRNPLAPIQNGLQLLAMMKLGEDAENVRAMMARQVEQIVHLVDDLMDVSRIGCGKLALDKQVCIVKAIVDAAIEESIILISENGLSLEVIDRSQAACVCGDRTRLTQVVCNLLNNSAKYGRTGGKIVLELDVRDSFVLLRIRDDGIGIAAERLQDIFKMYSQIEGAQDRRSVGLGIGLALVKTLVELHGGFVNAESEGPNLGSTFTVQLPLATGIQCESLAPQTVTGHSSRKCRILIVDDMKAMRVVTEQLLVKLGHTVQVAENGRTALEMLDSFKPDIVFSDVSMPGMDGHELAREIRKREDLSSVHLVAMTGYGQPSDRETAFNAGFDHHLTKPVALQRLRELFDELNDGAYHAVS